MQSHAIEKDAFLPFLCCILDGEDIEVSYMAVIACVSCLRMLR